jgi:hypothetical protein
MIASLRGSESDLKGEVAALHAKLETTTQALADETTAHDQTKVSHATELTDKAAEIATLESSVATHKQQLTSVEDTLATATTNLKQKTTEVSDLTTTNQQLEKEIANMKYQFGLQIQAAIDQTKKHYEDALSRYSFGQSDPLFNRCTECKFEFVFEKFSKCKNCASKAPCRNCTKIRWIPRAGLCEECLRGEIYFCWRCNEKVVSQKGETCESCPSPTCIACGVSPVYVEGTRCSGCTKPKCPHCGNVVEIPGEVCFTC